MDKNDCCLENCFLLAGINWKKNNGLCTKALDLIENNRCAHKTCFADHKRMNADHKSANGDHKTRFADHKSRSHHFQCAGE
ncbi:hypothetical protein [Planococcus salinarum]|uniref:hypothetical protein n=1 Tax=Planococcus salinarum TaxID=622695 RepID=UPI00115F6694|nr:hypothetical protein [Planococcus salinarum]